MKYPIIRNAGSRGLLRKTVNLLKKGELVVIPTETVYGLAARADNPDAVGKLFLAKNRRGSKKLAYLVRDIAHMLRLHPNASPKAQILARKFWPGSLTIIDKFGDATFGFRCPATVFTLNLASAAEFPIYITSANISGKLPIFDAVAALKQEFQVVPSLIIDSGPTECIKPSTVILVDGEKVSLLRAGALPASYIPGLEE